MWLVGKMEERKNSDVFLAGLKTKIMTLKTISCDRYMTEDDRQDTTIQYNVNIALKTTDEDTYWQKVASDIQERVLLVFA